MTTATAPTLIMRTPRDRRPYRLKCRFKIEPSPDPVRDFMGHARWMSRLETEKVRIAERFVTDMHKQGWENIPPHGFRMRGPFPRVEPTTIHVVRQLTAREMLPRVMRGERFLDRGHDSAVNVPKIGASEWWEFEISGVFQRPQVMVEIPGRHEEEH